MDDDDILWPAPPVHVSLDRQSVHVWAVSLQVPDDVLNRLAKMLAPAERRRAESFHFDRDRNRFMAGRGTLRTILGYYLHAPPPTVELTVGSHGKPSLEGPLARGGLHFNLAHCEDLALLAVTRGCVVGVDLERIRAMDNTEEMAACFCSPRESAEFQFLPPGERATAFFRLWTRKEAWLKATGQGIGESLDSVEVSFRAGQAACFIRLPEESGPPASAWSLRELTPALGFVAALALPGEATEISCWHWKKQKEELEYA
jgi:4'-phosphopantetheinyl transferase